MRIRLLLLAALIPLAGCSRTLTDPEAGAAREPATVPPSIKPADAQQPSTEICAEAEGQEAIVIFNPAFPDPRCLIVHPDQHLRVVNRLGKRVGVELGRVNMTVENGQESLAELPFGEYLAPGVHFIKESFYAGDPEIWLQ